MSYSPPNWKPARPSRSKPLTNSGGSPSAPANWQRLVSGSIALPSLSATDWPAALPDLPTTPIQTRTPDDPFAWLSLVAPGLMTAPPADHHRRFWAHVWDIRAGERPAPYVLILARGGAKSTSAELATIALLAKQTRRYAWYISRTQDQADEHVQSIAEILESPELARLHPQLGERLLSKYGYSEGWRVNRLRASDGSTIDAIGLDKAARGRRVGRQRPDLMIIDDIDDIRDSQDATQAILDSLRLKLLPAGAPGLAVIAVQNLIIADGVFARLAERRGDILQDAIIDGPHPALLPHPGREDVINDDGTVDGIPTWQGQNVAVCNDYVRDQGLPAFLAECQHDVARAGRRFAQWRDDLHIGDPPEWSQFRRFWAAMDYGYDHPLAFGVFGLTRRDEVWLLAEYGARELLVTQHVAAFDDLLRELGVMRLSSRVAGRDLWATRAGETTAETLADQFARHGWRFEPANVDRVNGWQAIAERLGDERHNIPPRFFVAPRCEQTAKQLSALRRDPKRPNDALKVNANSRGEGGDDFADMCRYGVMAARCVSETAPGVLAQATTKGWQ